MVVNLHIPQLKDREKQICDLVGDRMVAFYKEEKEKLNTTGSLFAGLFVAFKKTDNGRILEPVIDEHRFHCENFLAEIKYRPNGNLAKFPRSVPNKNSQLQYILQGAEDLAQQIGGKEMKMIYNSLIVSEPFGKNQAWHFDVHDSHAPDFPVLAMIISLNTGTTVEAKINGHIVEIDIPVGSALAFDGKNFLHRGLSYPEINSRIYLKFSTKTLVSTSSGEAEVAPLLCCSGCNQQVEGTMKSHQERCYEYLVSAGMSPDGAIKFIANVTKTRSDRNKRHYNKSKSCTKAKVQKKK
jgi:hypothetical protein